MMNQSMKNGSQHKIQKEYIKNSFKIIQYVTILCFGVYLYWIYLSMWSIFKISNINRKDSRWNQKSRINNIKAQVKKVPQTLTKFNKEEHKVVKNKVYASFQVENHKQFKFEETKASKDDLNKPKCSICFERIEYAEISPLNWGDMFHKVCLRSYFNTRIWDSNIPITCPDWTEDIWDFDIKHFCDDAMYERYLKFQFQSFVEQNNDTYFYWPTADWKFVFEWNGDRKNQHFTCKIWNHEYCIQCRVKWHEGLSCDDYK